MLAGSASSPDGSTKAARAATGTCTARSPSTRRSTLSAPSAGAACKRSSSATVGPARPASAVERFEITLVADAADGDDQLRRRVVALDALAQPPHVDIDRAR